jgi:hypothetical protein
MEEDKWAFIKEHFERELKEAELELEGLKEAESLLPQGKQRVIFLVDYLIDIREGFFLIYVAKAGEGPKRIIAPCEEESFQQRLRAYACYNEIASGKPWDIFSRYLDEQLLKYEINFLNFQREPRNEDEWAIWYRSWHANFNNLYKIFIAPITPYIELRKTPHLIVNIFEGRDERLYERLSQVDFQLLFDQRFLFGRAGGDEDVLVTKIHPSLLVPQAVRNIQSFQKPKPQDMLVLFTLRKKGVESRGISPIEDKEWEAWQVALEAAEQKGATVIRDAPKKHFIDALSNRWAKKVIQLIAHYDYWSGTLEIYDEKKQPFTLDELEKELTELEKQGRLRDDIHIDAYACKSFSGFADKLYAHGAKLVLAPPNYRGRMAAVAVLSELYSCQNSSTPDCPYLDGQTYLHEAWHKVWKNFFIKANKGEAIEFNNVTGF